MTNYDLERSGPPNVDTTRELTPDSLRLDDQVP